MLLPTTRPFSFAHTLTFIQRFLPIRGDYLLGEDSLTAAVAIGDRAVAFTLRDIRGELHVDSDDAEVARRASDFISARDDLAPFYVAAAGDPAFRPYVAALHGLHQVRFMTLEEISVYAVMMQRAPIAVAATLRKRFLDRFGLRARGGLRAFPSFARLVELDGDSIGEAIGNRRKGPQIATVVRGVAAIGEARLRSAPYAEAKELLLDVPGIGPFSAGAILLRGLGRMDELPEPMFHELGREIYGARFDAHATLRRYGAHIGYWSFYAKTGGALRTESSRGMRSSAA